MVGMTYHFESISVTLVVLMSVVMIDSTTSSAVSVEEACVGIEG